MARRATWVWVPLAAVAGAAVVAAAGYVTAAAAVARTVVTPARRHKTDVVVLSVADDRSAVRLGGTADVLTVPGRYGLWFDDERGYAQLGDIVVDHGDGTVTRAVERVLWGDLAAARTGRISGWFHASPDGLGLPVRSVDVPVDGGSAPGWVFPAATDTDRWAIHVHGRGTQRQEALRAVPLFRDRGYTSLVVSYRNDGDAPSSDDGRYGLGSTEWRDVDAALAFALAHGARHVVLFGWSMGGAIVLQTAVRSPRADSIRGIVLDSPVVDWTETLRFQAAQLRLPEPVTAGALIFLDAPWATRAVGHDEAVGLAALDFTARAHELQVPILLLHSDDDGFVPAGASHRLADLRPDIVTFVPFRQAKHTKLWNLAPAKWDAAIGDWLETTNARIDALERAERGADVSGA